MRKAVSRITHHASRARHPLRRRDSAVSQAFTLVEILVTVALLSIITLGLFAVFNQVQRAFRSSMNQVDQLEAGRAVTEMLPRELEQTIPSGSPFPDGVNFYALIPNSAPLTQYLPGMGTTTMRMNLLEDCFMLSRSNRTWIGIGYCVRTADAAGRLSLPECKPGQMGVGTLYRYYATTNVLRTDDLNKGLPSDPGQLFRDFAQAAQPGSAAILSRICDGVIHFRFRAFDADGVLITPLAANTNNMDIRFSTVAPGEVGLYKFCSNAVPASVEMELGILEQRVWDRYSSIGDPNARLAYLQRAESASRVHLFRQRIPIRNFDPLAYQ
jgi:prepilin-type N-terminal cleavage/methylation domain-containing protein